MTTATAKRQALREAMASDRGALAIGAHDALTGLLAGRYGFDAVWVSGLAVATTVHALPDINLTTHTETLEAAVRIDRATELPVIADCDNGFGALNNVVRTVREFDAAGIAAVSIEDNLFPKRNSLMGSDTRRELIPLAEQARRLRAAKGAQPSTDFMVIARVESLIAGEGVEMACRRADAYVEAGVDAILIHSRDKTLAEIEGFLASWSGLGSVPLVAVPTLFPTFTREQLREKGFNLVILANQPMRAAVKAVEETLATLASERRASAVDPHIATVEHLFDLVGTREAIAAEDDARV
ncbi:MAG: phosphoenolpyruvate phosphomutase [Chloroflexi bacterium]|nr:phosphoenolpyruvate phosphomutase [Chloroflexota bacterium]